MGSAAMEVDDGTLEFTLAEAIEMENLYKKNREKIFSQEFCKEIAGKFSSSCHRSGKPAIVWEQVQTWFQIKQRSLEGQAMIPQAAYERSAAAKGASAKKGEKEPEITASDAATELPGLRFEAKSAKDNSWFDVASFLSYKVLYPGELVVRVRFSGFGVEEDEWVNVKSAVRERSIPLEPSECDKINVGDLVLCFREAEHAALYWDAHIVDVRRRLHERKKCTCVFVVRYDFDDSQGEVSWDKLCYRPTKQTQSLPSRVFGLSDVKVEEIELFSF